MRRVMMGVAILTLSACMHTSYVGLDPTARYAPVDPYDVIVYVQETDVPYEFEPIALVHARGNDDWTDESDMIEAMREETAELGAHGIIIEWIDEPSGWEHAIEHLADVEIADRPGEGAPDPHRVYERRMSERSFRGN